jgi:hypothetical protein
MAIGAGVGYLAGEALETVGDDLVGAADSEAKSLVDDAGQAVENEID